MPKTDNPHAIRLYDSLAKQTDEQTAERIVNRIPLSKSADINKKFAWAESVCADLQNAFDDDTVKKIRMDCACGPEIGKINKLRKVYQASSDINEFVAKANNLNQGFTMQNDGDVLYLLYPECYCSCVKRVATPLPEIWCYCTLGYTKKMFEHIFNRSVVVELLESVKAGGTKCVIKII